MSLPAFPLALPGMALPNENSSLLTQQAANPVSQSAASSVYHELLDPIGGIGGIRKAGPGGLMGGLSGLFSSSDLFGLRGITVIIGLLLLAAGFFSHPAVRERIVAVGKTAGKAAALAA